MEDGGCKLGLQGRLELVTLIENGSPATAHGWWRPWQAATVDERASRACLHTRCWRPRSCPWALSSEDEQAILSARAKTNYGPMQLEFLTGRHRSTIWKGLASSRRLAPALQRARAELAAL